MSLPSIKNRVGCATATTGTGTITLGSAESGYQSFSSAYGANANVDILIEDGTAWEIARDCTYDNSAGTVTRGSLEASSTGSAITLTGSAKVYVIDSAYRVKNNAVSTQAVMPGGRLTLTSGTPVTTSDVTGATTVYYTPYIHSVIPLWDGAAWVPTVFSETSLALGTVTSGKPYDVFGYLSSGSLALEKLVWTDDTTRATAITMQDGQYCKSGDHTRLYLGTFYTTGTTTTEDSQAKRYLWNAYNRVDKFWLSSDASANTYGHTYSTNGYRKYNNGDYLYIDFVVGLGNIPLRSVCASVQITNNAGPTSQFSVNWSDGSGMDPGINRHASTAMVDLESLWFLSTGDMLSPSTGGRYRLHAVERCTSTTGTVTWGWASIRGYFEC